MADKLEAVEAFTKRSQDESHTHLTTDEARAFYWASTEGLIGAQPLLHEAKTKIVGCTACSGVFIESQPSSHAQSIAGNILKESDLGFNH